MVKFKSAIKKLISTTLIISLALTSSITTTLAGDSFDSNAGSGDSSASGSTVAGSSYSDDNQGVRMYCVDTNGNIVGKVVDITYNNPMNYINLGNSQGKALNTTKFGEFDNDSNSYAYAFGEWSDFFPAYELSDGTSMSAMPLPVEWISDTNIQVYGDTMREYFMGTEKETNQAMLKYFINEKGGGDIFNLTTYYSSSSSIASDIFISKGLRLIMEPIMWYHPHDWDSEVGGLVAYSAIDYWVYGTPTGIGAHLAPLVTGTGGYSVITNTYEPISMIIMDSLEVGDKKIDTLDTLNSPASGTKFTNVELANSNSGHGIHAYDGTSLGETADTFDILLTFVYPDKSGDEIYYPYDSTEIVDFLYTFNAP